MAKHINELRHGLVLHQLHMTLIFHRDDLGFSSSCKGKVIAVAQSSARFGYPPLFASSSAPGANPQFGTNTYLLVSIPAGLRKRVLVGQSQEALFSFGHDWGISDTGGPDV